MALVAPHLQDLTRIGARMLDVLFPPGCLKCGVELEADGALGAACWARIKFIAPPYCACCGLPFDFDVGAAALCGPCVQDRPIFDRARAVFVYDDVSRDLILSFKHADRTQAAPAVIDRLVAGFVEAGIAERVDLIAAEPLVVAPCALAFDDQGRLFVVENRGYPTGGPDVAPTVFVKNARYDQMMAAFGGVGVYATTPEQLRLGIDEAFRSRRPTLINAVIDETAGTESGRITSLNPTAAKKTA